MERSLLKEAASSSLRAAVGENFTRFTSQAVTFTPRNVDARLRENEPKTGAENLAKMAVNLFSREKGRVRERRKIGRVIGESRRVPGDSPRRAVVCNVRHCMQMRFLPTKRSY